MLSSTIQVFWNTKKVAGGNPPTIAGSHRVLTTATDDGREFLIALAPSKSLRPWVQQGLPVIFVTEACTYLCRQK